MRKSIFCFAIAFSFLLKGQSLQLGGIEPFADRNEYTTATIAFSVANTTLTTFNIVRLVKGDPHRSNAFFGLLFGTAQITYGLFNVKSSDKNANICTGLNIGVGLATIVSSGLRLIKKKNSDERTTFNIYYLPKTCVCSATVGFIWSRRVY